MPCVHIQLAFEISVSLKISGGMIPPQILSGGFHPPPVSPLEETLQPYSQFEHHFKRN